MVLPEESSHVRNPPRNKSTLSAKFTSSCDRTSCVRSKVDRNVPEVFDDSDSAACRSAAGLDNSTNTTVIFRVFQSISEPVRFSRSACSGGLLLFLLHKEKQRQYRINGCSLAGKNYYTDSASCPIPISIFCGHNSIDAQDYSSYTPPVKKQCLKNHRVADNNPTMLSK